MSGALLFQVGFHQRAESWGLGAHVQSLQLVDGCSGAVDAFTHILGVNGEKTNQLVLCVLFSEGVFWQK